MLAIHEHRRLLRSKVEKGKGGLRDEVRRIYHEHFDASAGRFTQSFVIGTVGDVCERAFAVGSSLSEATFVKARADVTLARSERAGRKRERNDQRAIDRRHLDAYVCA